MFGGEKKSERDYVIQNATHIYEAYLEIFVLFNFKEYIYDVELNEMSH
jgi:hypothetical protein